MIIKAAERFLSDGEASRPSPEEERRVTLGAALGYATVASGRFPNVFRQKLAPLTEGIDVSGAHAALQATQLGVVATSPAEASEGSSMTTGEYLDHLANDPVLAQEVSEGTDNVISLAGRQAVVQPIVSAPDLNGLSKAA